MAEKKSPKPRARKREPAKPERAEGKAKAKASRAAKASPARRDAKAPPKTETVPGDIKAPRKRALARPAAPPAVAVGGKRRGLRKPVVAETVSLAVASPEPVPKRVVRRRAPERKLRPAAVLAAGVPVPDAGLESSVAPLTEEERIESSKYEVRERPRRVFEEERFLFPETYEADRVRLLVKDPEWLFAHWDVSPGSMQRLRDDVGERAMAMSRLTLKVGDPADRALSVVLLPEGARSWYVRTHLAHRAYRAQLGLTMPSGEFRPLATSNVVIAPRGGPSPQRARRRVAFSRAHASQAAAELLAGAGSASNAESTGAGAASEGVTAVRYIDGTDEPPRPEAAQRDQGGASDELGPGGASDAFRR